MRGFVRLAGVLLLFCAPALMAGVVLQPTPAPEWEVSEWLNGDPGTLADHRGQVVVIGFFQLWCPASREFAIPLLERWSALYGGRGDVVIVLLHSVFEGHDLQSPTRLAEFVRENGIVEPVGIDAYDDGSDRVPVTLRRYEAGGTPHLVIVDQEGMLRFTHFGVFDPEPIEGFIDRLLDESRGRIGRTFAAAPRAERDRPQANPGLSGAYLFRADPASGACAGWIPATEALGEVRVHRDAIDIDFAEPLLGISAIELSYDAETGRFEGEGRPAASGRGGAGHGQVAQVEGVLDRDARPPELDFELSLFDGKCVATGRARAKP